MQITTVKAVKKGEFIQLLNKDNKPQKKIFERGAYNRSAKKFELSNYWDVNDFRLIKADHKCIIADF